MPKFNDMNTDMMHDVLALAEPKEITLDGRPYTTGKVHPVLNPTPDTLRVSTLTAVKDYLHSNRDNLAIETLIVHVAGPTKVRVLSTLLGDFEQRACHLVAEPMLPDYGRALDNWWASEDFIPLLQSLFLETPHQKALLRLLGSVRIDNGADLKDDGMTQTVTIKTGAAFMESAEIPNPVTLKPYCTFPDVEQPNRLFTFRMKDNASCRLIEADGGAWKQVAALSVKDWLEETLPEGVTVIA